MRGYRTLKRGARSGIPMRQDSELKDPVGLVRAIADGGDREAFAALFDFYTPRIKGFLLRSGSSAELAEDIAQETLIAVWRKAALFDPSRASVATWIFTIARNLRIDRVRRDRVLNRDTLNDILGAGDPVRPDDTLADDDRDARVRKALEGLSGDQLAVIKLSFFEDKPHSEISRLLGVPLGTVKSRLRLAMNKLRERLENVL